MNHRHRNGLSGSPYGFDARQREQDEQMKMLHVGAVIYFGYTSTLPQCLLVCSADLDNS